MKILHVTATHLKPDGGVPVVLKELATAQNCIENVKSLVISLVAPVDEMNSDYFKFVSSSKFEKFVLNYRPDYVILHSFYYLEYNKVVHVLNKNRIPYFIEPHGSFGKAAMRKSWLKKFLANKTIFRKQINCSFGFIFLNDSEKKDSIYRSQHDLVIPNGINILAPLKPVKTNEKFSFYFIGRYDVKHKGLDYMLKAFEILDQKGYRFVINMWGSGDEASLEFIKNKIKRFVNLTVNCNGSIYGEAKSKILEQHGPMILTSRYEGFPMTVLEAWSYGNPCIVTSGTNVLEEIVDNGLGWGVDLDASAIADGIVVAANEYKQNTHKYIEKCKQYVLNNYSWDKIAEKSISSFKEL